MRIVVVHPGKLKKKKDSLIETLQSLAVFSSAVSDFFFVLECLEQKDSLLSRLVRTTGFRWRGVIFFFCPRGSVIRCPTTPTHQPTPLLSANVMQRISKYCLGWLKTAHYLRLLAVWFEPPQSNACNPKRRRNCHPKDDLPSFFFIIHFSSTPGQTSQSN